MEISKCYHDALNQSFTFRTSVPQSDPSFQPTCPATGQLVGAEWLDLCSCPCPTPQRWVGRPMSRLLLPGLRSAPCNCSCLRRDSPVWRRASRLGSSASLPTFLSSTTRRLSMRKSHITYSQGFLNSNSVFKGCLDKGFQKVCPQFGEAHSNN